MLLSSAIELLHYDIQGQIANKLQIVPILRGNPGIGKTASLKMLAHKMGYQLYYLSLGSKPLEYFSGIPDIVTEAPDTVYARWSLPELIYDVNKLAAQSPVIVLLDDIHVMDMNAQKYMFELLLERSLHGKKLHPEVALVASANSSEKSGWEGFFAAIINRFKFYDVSFDFTYWMQEYAYRLNYHVTSFLRVNPDFVSEEERTDQPFASPRAWSELASYIDLVPPNIVADKLMDISKSYVSEEAAFAFSAFYKTVVQYELENKLKTRQLELTAQMEVPEQIMWGIVVRFIADNQDIEYLMTVLKQYAVAFPNFAQSLALEAQAMAKNKHALAPKLLTSIASDKDLMPIIARIFV